MPVLHVHVFNFFFRFKHTQSRQTDNGAPRAPSSASTVKDTRPNVPAHNLAVQPALHSTRPHAQILERASCVLSVCFWSPSLAHRGAGLWLALTAVAPRSSHDLAHSRCSGRACRASGLHTAVAVGDCMSVRPAAWGGPVAVPMHACVWLQLLLAECMRPS